MTRALATVPVVIVAFTGAWSQVPGRGRVGRVHEHRDGGRPAVLSSGGDGAHRGDDSRGGLVVGQSDGHLVADGHLGLLIGAQSDADLACGRGGGKHRLARLGRAAQDGRHRGDPHRGGFEHRLTEAERAVLGHTQGGLELLHTRLGPPGELIGGGAELCAGHIAERDEIGVEFFDVCPGHALRQRAVGGRRTVEEHDRRAAHLVKDLALSDDLADSRQRGNGSLGLVDHRVAAGVAERGRHLALRGQILTGNGIERPSRRRWSATPVTEAVLAKGSRTITVTTAAAMPRAPRRGVQRSR